MRVFPRYLCRKASLKKTLFTYWHQGFDSAPPVVKACLENAKRTLKDWEVHQLAENNVTSWIDPIPIPKSRWQQLCLAHRSDLIRTQLLIKHGGVWADPTVWFNRPLDDWLPEQMSAGLFLFQRPGRDRAISNWFIAAEPGNRLLVCLYENLCRYWSDNEFDNFNCAMRPGAQMLHKILRRHIELPRLWLKPSVIRLFRAFPYMIYHYMFYDIVRRDTECWEIWKNMSRRSADLPHTLSHYGLLKELQPAIQRHIDEVQSPLYKLSWKLSGTTVPKGSVLDYLLSAR